MLSEREEKMTHELQTAKAELQALRCVCVCVCVCVCLCVCVCVCVCVCLHTHTHTHCAYTLMIHCVELQST